MSYPSTAQVMMPAGIALAASRSTCTQAFYKSGNQQYLQLYRRAVFLPRYDTVNGVLEIGVGFFSTLHPPIRYVSYDMSTLLVLRQ